jgi:hypothetical protein
MTDVAFRSGEEKPPTQTYTSLIEYKAAAWLRKLREI